MKVSEVIEQLNKFLETVGDVELYKETGDGRSTWAERYTPKLDYTVIWKGHSEPKHWYIK